MNHDVYQKIFMLCGYLFVIGFFVIAYIIIRKIWKAFKNMDRANSNTPPVNASKTKYTYEARKACEDVKPKRKQEEKPPWEE